MDRSRYQKVVGVGDRSFGKKGERSWLSWSQQDEQGHLNGQVGDGVDVGVSRRLLRHMRVVEVHCHRMMRIYRRQMDRSHRPLSVSSKEVKKGFGGRVR